MVLVCPLASVWLTNLPGKVTRIDEPKGAWLTHHYDSIGNLIKTVVGGVTTTMEYDIRGNKTTLKFCGRVWILRRE
jgi:uncharacterized protein RhaS with RHS repeats